MSSPEVDELDKEDLTSVKADSKMPCAKISRVVGVPEATLKFRVNRLVQRNVSTNATIITYCVKDAAGWFT